MNHNFEKRHKCHYCGAVRYEHLMVKLIPGQAKAVSQFGNDQKCWSCLNECWSDNKLVDRPLRK